MLILFNRNELLFTLCQYPRRPSPERLRTSLTRPKVRSFITVSHHVVFKLFISPHDCSWRSSSNPCFSAQMERPGRPAEAWWQSRLQPSCIPVDAQPSHPLDHCRRLQAQGVRDGDHPCWYMMFLKFSDLFFMNNHCLEAVSASSFLRHIRFEVLYLCGDSHCVCSYPSLASSFLPMRS